MVKLKSKLESTASARCVICGSDDLLTYWIRNVRVSYCADCGYKEVKKWDA